MKRVLVTGATGFIGRWTPAKLLQQGYEVHICGRHPSLEHATAVVRHRVDLLEAGEPTRVIRAVRPTHLLHLAWYATHNRFWEAPENLHFTSASIELVRAFSDFGGSRLVVSGTCAEYDWRYGYCTEGVTPLDPVGLYGVTKDALRRVLEGFSRERSLSWAWGRPFLLYGPGESPERLVPSAIRAMLAGEETRLSHGRQLRDFIHVEDVASALVMLLDSHVEGPVNIASGSPISIKALVCEIATLLGTSHLVRFGAIESAGRDPAVLLADVGRLTREVGFQPKWSLATGLEDAIEWWRKAERSE